MYGPYLTKAEIGTKFPNEWVFVANPECTPSYNLLGGYVVFHAAELADFYRLIENWNDPAVKHSASWSTGASGGAWEVLPPDAKPAPETASR